jgi:hypothetical protein
MPICNLRLSDKEFASLRGCPCCGSFFLELRNTHTAAYWIACLNCEEEGYSVEISGRNIGSGPSFELTLAQHEAAKASAIEAWNRRVS